MDNEEDNQIKGTIKRVFKSKFLIILLIIVLVVPIFGMISAYIKFKEDFVKLSKKNSTYDIKVNAQGKIVVTSEDGSEEMSIDDMAEAIVIAKSLDNYIDGTDEERKEKVRNLICAELVTKCPYIDDLEGSEDSINGQIKFYRYGDESESEDAYDGESLKEKYRITYKTQEQFETLLANYRDSGDTQVLKHFTVNDDGNVVIATTTKEDRTITTDDEEITPTKIEEVSGESGYAANGSDGYSKTVFTANTRPIDYLSLVQQYVLPTNLLYALLIQTRDIDFVEAIANLAYENEIAIGIYDNESITTNDESFNYKKIMGMNIKTKLDFSNISTTTPSISRNDLYNSPYSKIPSWCSASTNLEGEQKGKIPHYQWYYDESEGSTSTDNNNYMYVTGESEGLITSLGETAKEFYTKFHKEVTSKATPTMGVILADTWIARWKATYEKQEKDPIGSSNSGDYEDDTVVREYKGNYEVLNAFESDTKTNISNALNTHANSLKSKAIDRIVSLTNFTVVPGTIDVSDLSDSDRELLLLNHLMMNYDSDPTNNNTADNCWELAYREWIALTGRPIPNTIPNPTTLSNAIISQIINVVQNELDNNQEGAFSYTDVGRHYRQALQGEVTRRNKQAQDNAQQQAEANKANFKQSLEDQITISQDLEANKLYVDISFSSTYTSKSSVYEKNEDIQRDKEGIRFSEIFRDNKYYESRQAILVREQWLWEYIRENEDTAKIEDIFRYLLNIATETNDFGSFSEEDIENFFAAFEPQELIMDNNSGGMSVHEYLAQYGGDYTVYEFEGVQYYAVINDTAGNPTVGAGDIQWRSHYDKYSATATLDNIQVGMLLGTGTVRQGNEVYENVDVMEKVNELLENGKDTKWKEDYKPPENKIIYIDKQTCDNVAENLAKRFYNEVLINTNGLNLSRQQLYALTFIKHATGNLTDVATSENESTERPFSVVFNEAAQLYEINSWEFNRYIWENWWSTKWPGGYSDGRYYGGWLKSRDASFETYVKGTYNFGGTNQAGATREKNGYMFYSQEDISKIGFSSSPQKINRNKNNAVAEEELFTYVETQNASVVVDFALQFEGKTAPEIGLWGYKTSDGVSLDPNEWCAMFVSYCFDNCGMIDSIGGTYKSCSAKLNSMEENSNTKSQIINLREDYSNNYMPGYIPKAGDVIFFYWGKSDARSDHTGIVVDCDGSTVYTIEGNTGASDDNKSIVKRREYSVDSVDICAYLIPR